MDSSKHLSLSLKALAVALGLGLAGNALLRDEPWGLGFALYVGVVLVACVHLYRQRPLPLGRSVLPLAPVALVFAGFFAWRDAPALKLLNGLAVAVLVGLAAHRARQGGLARASVVELPFAALGRWLFFLSDGVLLASLEGRWKVVGQGRDATKMLAVGRGLLLAFPLLVVFGALFAQADAGFERLLTQSFSLDAGALWSHFSITALCAWFAGGLLYRLFLAIEKPPVVAGTGVVPPKTRLGATEVAIVLGLLDLLFLAFVISQLGYFFGGESAMRGSGAADFREYVRRGFFELVTAAALALPVLLGAHAILREAGDEERGMRLYRPLALTLVVLLFVVMASATHRMVLYVDNWGITQLRIYVFASLAWLAVLFLWFCATVLRARPERFAFGGFVAFLFGVAALNAANPDMVVARSFLARGTTTRIEPEYVNNLSDDAVPSIAAALGRVPAEAREELERGLRMRESRLFQEDWRSWDLGSARARQALEARDRTARLP